MDQRGRVGTAGHPAGDMWHLTYIGPREELRGETALVSCNLDGDCVAQFDHIRTGYSAGWHRFSRDDFSDVSDE